MRVIRMMDCGITQRERGRTGKEYSSGQYVAPEHPGSRALRMLDRYELEAGVSWGPERHHQLDLLILTEDRPMNLRLDERSPQRMPARSFARIHTGAGCDIAVHPAHSGQDTTFFMASVATRDPHGDLDPVTT